MTRTLVLVTDCSSCSSDSSCSRIVCRCSCTSPALSSSAVRSVSRAVGPLDASPNRASLHQPCRKPCSCACYVLVIFGDKGTSEDQQIMEE